MDDVMHKVLVSMLHDPQLATRGARLFEAAMTLLAASAVEEPKAQATVLVALFKQDELFLDFLLSKAVCIDEHGGISITAKTQTSCEASALDIPGPEDLEKALMCIKALAWDPGVLDEVDAAKLDLAELFAALRSCKQTHRPSNWRLRAALVYVLRDLYDTGISRHRVWSAEYPAAKAAFGTVPLVTQLAYGPKMALALCADRTHAKGSGRLIEIAAEGLLALIQPSDNDHFYHHGAAEAVRLVAECALVTGEGFADGAGLSSNPAWPGCSCRLIAHGIRHSPDLAERFATDTFSARVFDLLDNADRELATHYEALNKTPGDNSLKLLLEHHLDLLFGTASLATATLEFLETCNWNDLVQVSVAVAHVSRRWSAEGTATWHMETLAATRFLDACLQCLLAKLQVYWVGASKDATHAAASTCQPLGNFTRHSPVASMVLRIC
ncbi:hypothetical protein WJX72_011402 [[Myrmecia] bisecta]|uniref:Uncharacterized protein n=1 Tax=[Myrmecia] bisecta TaxID=41462 RepID=A0AAW1PUG8_9CHLO